MKSGACFRFVSLALGWLLLAQSAQASSLSASDGEGEQSRPVPRSARVCCVVPSTEDAPWMYMAPRLPVDWVARLRQRTAGNPHHVQFRPDVRSLPTGLPERFGMRRRSGSAYSLAGLGASYALRPGLLATTTWNTGIGSNSVVPGHQFSLGVAFKY